jgi:hypothetical protein
VKKLAIAASLVALLAPTSASAHGKHRYGPVKPAVTACKAERTDLGAQAFADKYANKRGKRALKRCVSRHVVTAVRSCRTERKADKAAFRATYGRGAKKRRAFVRCVSTKLRAVQPAA